MDKNNQNTKKDFHVDNLIKKINNFLSTDKPADVLIIKAHLLCEYYMNHLLILEEICTVNEVESLTFAQKTEKIKSIFNLQDLSQKKNYDMIGRLNKLRNKVGHELTYSLSESDVDNLGYTQGKQYILDKYDVETDIERLRNILIQLVIGVAWLLIGKVNAEKNKHEKN